MKHGRSTRGAAPVSDAVGRGGDAAARMSGRVLPHGFHVFLADSRRHGSDSGLIHAESGRLGPESADSGLNRPYRPKRPIEAEI